MRAPRAIERWWHCAAAFEEINRKLQRAGIRQHDPMSPLIAEMAMAPQRMGRWLVLWALMLLTALGLAASLIQALSDRTLDQVTTTSKGRLLVISAPSGARFIECPAGTVCVEVFSNP